MSNWWKNPVLQGPENDYGDYDYLIEEIPSNDARWSRYYEKCDCCGKEHDLNRVYTGYFRTMDGYDSMSECECWKCWLQRKAKEPFKRMSKKIKKHLDVKKQVRAISNSYKKTIGKQLPKERQQSLYNIFAKY